MSNTKTTESKGNDPSWVWIDWKRTGRDVLALLSRCKSGPWMAIKWRGTYGKSIRGIRNQKASLVSRHPEVSWRFEEMGRRDCPRIYSPFQPHHRQQQHLCEWENGGKSAKGVSELGETRGKYGGEDIGWDDLHLIACISLTSFRHTAHDGGGGLNVRFGILKKLRGGTD